MKLWAGRFESEIDVDVESEFLRCFDFLCFIDDIDVDLLS